jgi:hypothetical protein
MSTVSAADQRERLVANVERARAKKNAWRSAMYAAGYCRAGDKAAERLSAWIDREFEAIEELERHDAEHKENA